MSIATPKDSLQETDAIGRFKRTAAGFRRIIKKSSIVDVPDASGDIPLFPEYGRYHLYISLACPWACRVYSVLLLKRLVGCVGVTIVHPTWQATRPGLDEHKGWAFYDSSVGTGLKSTSGHGNFHVERCELEPIAGFKCIRDLYESSMDSTGKYTVPVLLDLKSRTVVNNESSELLRMFSTEFNEWASGPFAEYDFCPKELETEIAEMNDFIYPNINDGVYKCGFAQSQTAYDEAFEALYSALERVEDILSKKRYLLGDRLTECDLRLFPTLVRFDEVYVVYFKCNGKRIIDFPNIRNYCRELYQIGDMRLSVDMEHIKTHYFTSHPKLNPYSIIPRGENYQADLEMSHNRNDKTSE